MLRKRERTRVSAEDNEEQDQRDKEHRQSRSPRKTRQRGASPRKERSLSKSPVRSGAQREGDLRSASTLAARQTLLSRGARSYADIPARVYKRWILVTIVLTLIFAWFLFPFWFNTRMMPANMEHLSELFFENNFFRMIPASEELFRNVTSILQPFWQSEFEEPFSPGRVLREKGARAKYPVVMIPGITSTGLELWEGKPCAQSYFRQRLWGTLTMMRIMVLNSACWLQHLKLNSTTGEDPDGIKLRPAQGLEAADFILPGFWVWARLIENLAEIGYDHNSLQMAAYDWRLDVVSLESRDHYFSRLKMQIEMLVRARGQKVVAVSHSLGGLIWLYFMKWVESSVDAHGVRGGAGGKDWVEKHVHATVSIGAPFLGLPKSLSSIISGEMRDTAQMGKLESFLLEMLMSKRERLSLFRTWCGGFAMLPKGGNVFWGDGTAGSNVDAPNNCTYGVINLKQPVADRIGMRSEYLTDDLSDIIEAFLPSSVSQRVQRHYCWQGITRPDSIAANDNVPCTWTNPLQSRLPHAPSMKIYNMYGVGKDTERGYEYDYVTRDQWPAHLQSLPDDAVSEFVRTDSLGDILVRIKLDLDAAAEEKRLYTGIYHVDGDGTVPTLSSGYMSVSGWRRLQHLNPANIQTVTKEYIHDPSSRLSDLRGGPRSSEHVDILGNHEMTEDILRIVSDHPRDHDGTLVEERVLSDIHQMAAKIKLSFG